MNKAQQHLALLRSSVPGLTVEIAAMSREFISQFPGIPPEIVSSVLNSLTAKLDLTDQLNLMAGYLLDVVIADDSAIATLRGLGDRLVLGAVARCEISAFTQLFNDGSYLIALGHGLAHLTWFACQVFGLTPAASQDVPGRQVRYLAVGRLITLAVAPIVAGEADGIVPPLLDNPASAITMGAAAVGSEGFLICHEFAHILLGHLDRPDQPGGPGGAQLPDGFHQQELDADLLAVRLLFSDVAAGRPTEFDPRLRVLGVWLCLLLMELHERAVYIVPPATYPANDTRWDRIRTEVLDQLLGADVIDAVFRRHEKFIRALRYIAPQVWWLRSDATFVGKWCRNVIFAPAWDQQTWRGYAHLHAALRQPPEAAHRVLADAMKRRGLPRETIGQILIRLFDAPRIVELRAELAAGGALSRSALYEAVIAASLDDAPEPVREVPRADFVPLLAELITSGRLVSEDVCGRGRCQGTVEPPVLDP
jgi:hypothetical protein